MCGCVLLPHTGSIRRAQMSDSMWRLQHVGTRTVAVATAGTHEISHVMSHVQVSATARRLPHSSEGAPPTPTPYLPQGAGPPQ